LAALQTYGEPQFARAFETSRVGRFAVRNGGFALQQTFGSIAVPSRAQKFTGTVGHHSDDRSATENEVRLALSNCRGA
jgi:hypothetical protein